MANKTAKIVRFHSIGGPEVLRISEEPTPEPEKGEVRLRVKAIGLNRAEVMFRNGQYLEAPVLPSKLGYEAAGVVEAVGPDVDNSWLGKKASTVPSAPTWTHASVLVVQPLDAAARPGVRAGSRTTTSPSGRTSK